MRNLCCRFPKSERLTGKKEIQRLFREAKIFRLNTLTFRYCTGYKHRKILVCVSKNVGAAHIRNTLKRYVREAWRQSVAKNLIGMELAVSIRPTDTILSFHEIRSTFERFCEKILSEE